MNIAQHASNILEAWKVRDTSGLGAALETASASCKAAPSVSRLENEKEEMLQSIVEHLRGLSSVNDLPDQSKGSGAIALLYHLSSSSQQRKFSQMEM